MLIINLNVILLLLLLILLPFPLLLDLFDPHFFDDDDDEQEVQEQEGFVHERLVVQRSRNPISDKTRTHKNKARKNSHSLSFFSCVDV